MNGIPKKLHLYWDRSPMSKLQTFTIDTFHKLNLDWEIYVYTPIQNYIGSLNYVPDYTGEDFFPRIENNPIVNMVEVDLKDYDIDIGLHNILRSDILRYHLLYDQGGVWSDFDVIWLKPISHFYNIDYYGQTNIDDVSAVVSFIKEKTGAHSIGIMIHCKHDPYVLSLINLTKQVKPPYEHEVFGSVMISNAYPTLDSLSGFENVIGTRFETYYPYIIHPPNETIQNLYHGNHLDCINNNVLCVHWYNGHKLSKEYVNNDGFNRDCSMTTILRNEGCI